MTNLIIIFVTILAPIFIQAGLGFFLRKKFELSIDTLIKIQMYVLIPSLLFYNIYTSEISGKDMIALFIFTTVLFFILMAIATLISRVGKMNRAKEKAFVNSVVLRNQGNFGIPLIALTFMNDSYAMSLHIIVLLATNLLLNTFGLYNASAGSYTAKDAMKNILKLPMIYVIVLALLCKAFAWQLPFTLIETTRLLGDGLIAIALMTLGIQLASTKVNFKDSSIYLSNFLRLIISPLIAFVMVKIVGYEGVMAQVLVLGAAAPTAVNSVLLALEFKGDATYASETVFTSTLFSALTVSVVVALVM